MKRYAIIVLVIVLAILMFCVGMILNSLIAVSTLESLAKTEGVLVYYVSTATMEKAQTEYNIDECPSGLYFSGTQQIWIDEWRYLDYWVLAHEIGHHFAIKEYGDHSEYAANVYGSKILKGGIE